MQRYLALLRVPGALVAFVSATVARLPISMATLGAVLLVQEARGSYALAGAVTACFALGSAVGTPFWGRLLDRHGQARVLAPPALISAVLLVALALGAVGGMPAAGLAGLAAGAGVSFPPVSPAMRAAWQGLLPAEDDRQAAYALEAVAIEMVFLLGPLVLSLLLATTPAEVPLIVTAVLLAGGTLAYVSTSASRAVRPHRPVGEDVPAGPRLSLFRSRAVVTVLASGAFLAAGFGGLDVAVAATAQGLFGHRELLGVLYLGVAGGSALGGLVYGARTWPGSDWQRLRFVPSGVALGMLLAAGYAAWLTPTDSPAVAAVVAAVVLLSTAGVFIAPSTIIQQNLADAHAGKGRGGEVQSLLSAAITAGAAGGTAVAGVLVDAGGAALSYGGAAVAFFGAGAVTLARGRRV
ncbi:MFS transporter [Spongisporangium articulatum]|uniref:MFS transporter n=1 Tax=Spongisporangium articulatum TaxID=3362603 RepID=A0ABW8AL66_9ACTN